MIQHTCEIQVRYAETDQMQFAHHSNYIIWFEHGRIQLLKNLGISYKDLEDGGYLMPVLEVHSRFIKYAVFDEILQLKTIMRDFPTAKQKFEYEIYNQKQELICTGSSLHSFINKEKKAIKPPKELREKLKPFFK
ncbi:MAG: acyl-CoA thioesterase [Calditrichae bacterium]|nr:acyl-CoA thioesterase [Calditrichia bacterium]